MKVIFILICYAIAFSPLYAQKGRAKDNIDLQIIKSAMDDLIVFEAVLINKLKTPQLFYYEFITINRSQGGNNTSRQKGSITANPQEKTILSTSKISKTQDLIYDVRLFIYQDDQLLKSTLLSSQQKKASAIPTIPKQSDINASHQEAALSTGGLIVDATRTRAGRDFYEMFYKQWQRIQVTTSLTIEVKEQFVRGRNTRIMVYVNDNLVYVSSIQPRFDLLEERVNIAVPRVIHYIQRQKKINNDLEKGDQSGSGIF